MNTYLFGALIAVLIYSIILTISAIYKDNSSYFILSDLDIILAGPACWILIVWIRFFIRPLFSLFPSKEKERKPKSKKYIKKIVKKIVNNYKKKKYHGDYFDFNFCFGDEYDDFAGYEDLLVKKPQYEWLNKHFCSLMECQKNEVLKELLLYFEPVTESRMIQDKRSEWYISDYKDKNLYCLKENYNNYKKRDKKQ